MNATKHMIKRWRRDGAVLLVIAGITVALIAGLMEWRTQQISKQYIRNTTLRAAEDSLGIARRLESVLVAARDYGVDPSDIEAAGHYFETTIFPSNPELSGISLAREGGESFYLLRDGTLTDIRETGRYNPEDRLWFQGAQETDGCYWSDIYLFKTLEKPGITIAVRGKNDSSIVVAFDVLLDDFFDAANQLAPTAASHTFVFEPNHEIYVSDSGSTNTRFKLLAADNSGWRRKGLDAWNDMVKKNGMSFWDKEGSSGVGISKIRFDHKSWWCGFVPLEKSRREVWLCVMVPESDIIGDVGVKRSFYISIGSVIFIAVAAIYLIFFRKQMGSPIVEVLNAQQVGRLTEKGESETVEFKSTMRMNLHRGKPGKEIEMAWLKGVAAFMNSDGGVLLLGVTDAGEITGLEQDLFENEDKCRLHFKNLIAAHLGADVSGYIRFSIVRLDEKSVGVVQCASAPRPVYLRDGNKEAFYIRNGPSSDELPASRMVDYIAEHWK